MPWDRARPGRLDELHGKRRYNGSLRRNRIPRSGTGSGLTAGAGHRHGHDLQSLKQLHPGGHLVRRRGRQRLVFQRPLVLANDNAGSSVPGLSDLQQAISYGTFLSFTLTLSGSEVSGGSSVPFTGSVFTFLLEDSTQTGLSLGPLAGEALDIYVNSGGSLTVASFGPATGNSPQLTISGAAVPEPSSVVLLSLGVAAVAVIGRFRKPRVL